MSRTNNSMITTCHACGKLVPRSKLALCSTCVLDEQNRFNIVREYLGQSGGGTVPEISNATGVSSVDVQRFLDSGRLVSTQPPSNKEQESVSDGLRRAS